MTEKKDDADTIQETEEDDIEEMMSSILDRLQVGIIGASSDKSIETAIEGCFEHKKWRYEYNSKNNFFTTGFNEKETPIKAALVARNGELQIYCRPVITIPLERFQDALWEINRVNTDLRLGRFILNPDNGIIVFKSEHVFTEKAPSPVFIDWYISVILETIGNNIEGFKKITEDSSNTNRHNPMFN